MARITVRVHPRAHDDRIVDLGEGKLEAWTHAPAVDGRANGAIIRLVAELKGLPPSAVQLMSGARSRTKVLEIPDR